MNSIVIKIKNLIPYLILIAIYFFFVNLEARKGKNNIDSNYIKVDTSAKKSNQNDTNLRMSIPVIPYNP